MSVRRFAVPAAIVVVAIALLIALAFGINHSGSNNSIAYSVQSGHFRVPVGDELPLDGVSGAPAHESLKDLRGKPVLVNFFANWCVQCQEEATELDQAEKVLKAHGGTVLGVSFEESPSAAKTYLSRFRLSYPTVSDPAGHLAGDWGITGVPDSYLIDPQGRIVWLNTYQLTPSFITTTLPQLLARFST